MICANGPKEDHQIGIRPAIGLVPPGPLAPVSSQMTPHVTICGLGELGFLLEAQDPEPPITHVVSLWDPPPAKDDGREQEEYLGLFRESLPDVPVLVLEFDDISGQVSGRIAPRIDHLQTILEFARQAIDDRGRDTHFLVHCQMGISRSPAAALAILAQCNPETSASDLVTQLGTIRKWVHPNWLLVQHADTFLDRHGALIEAVTTYVRSLAPE